MERHVKVLILFSATLDHHAPLGRRVIAIAINLPLECAQGVKADIKL
jgi:hypothetical protein